MLVVTLTTLKNERFIMNR